MLRIVEEDLSGCIDRGSFVPEARFYVIETPINETGVCREFKTREEAEAYITRNCQRIKTPELEVKSWDVKNANGPRPEPDSRKSASASWSPAPSGKRIKLNKILKVFPTQTNQTPLDDLTFFEEPGFWIPEHDEVHISCVFTWDKPRAEQLAEAWYGKAPVKIGGPAYDDAGGEFTPGLYTRKGIVHTSRGCPNKCKFCFVAQREGRIRELEVKEGNEIQDNNFLACSKQHRRKVYDMLRTQKEIKFIGGLESVRLGDWDIQELRMLRIKELWLACDTAKHIKTTTQAINKLRRAGFTENHIRCYVLIGDNMSENTKRLEAVYRAGALPFAQLFQPEERIEYSKDWKDFARMWSRPAIYKAMMRGGETDAKENACPDQEQAT